MYLIFLDSVFIIKTKEPGRAELSVKLKGSVLKLMVNESMILRS